MDPIELHPIQKALLEQLHRLGHVDVGEIVVQFGVTRQAVSQHLRHMVKKGWLTSQGRTRKKNWRVLPLAGTTFEDAISSNLAEDQVWRQRVEPTLKNLPDNVRQICQHGFTEIYNNAIEHSEGKTIKFSLVYSAGGVLLRVEDDGVGIFNKIKRECGLDDPREAILELSKGKLTTDPTRHSGEGIFFTSRMFDDFHIVSGQFVFLHRKPDNDWLIESQTQEVSGTRVDMSIVPWSERTVSQVFDAFASPGDDYGFSHTHVPLALARIGQEQLVSRSQAKRVLTRFERFKTVSLDFTGIDEIGQAFADEIFRVFQRQHPEIKIEVLRANSQVQKMIQHVLAETNTDAQQGSLFNKNASP
ncbi:MAG: DUF4325 domain-containing protein [Phycisphaeraceae bacterium]|nr:DUF4325 domain-containing protein [Phycisphaeraceae bacterium]